MLFDQGSPWPLGAWWPQRACRQETPASTGVRGSPSAKSGELRAPCCQLGQALRVGSARRCWDQGWGHQVEARWGWWCRGRGPSPWRWAILQVGAEGGEEGHTRMLGPAPPAPTHLEPPQGAGPSGTPTPAAHGQNSRFTQMRAHRGLEDSPAVPNTLCPSQDRRPHIPRHRQQSCSPVSECDTAPWLLPSGSPALALVSFLGCNSRCPAKVLWLG